jgi:phosphatidylethanolamine/phosphatidyl-N-methylethanolamine N-methyltransferase
MGIIYKFGGKVYDLCTHILEIQAYKKIRESILPKLRGNILEVGCGSGKNFEFYNPKAKITAVDNSKPMLKKAENVASWGPAKIKVKQMDATKLTLKSKQFDNIVATFLLCVLPKNKREKALSEMIRVAKKGAKIYILDYVYPKNKLKKISMKMTEPFFRLMYSFRHNAALPIMKKEKRIKIIKKKFVYQDVIILIVAQKK